MCNMWFNSDTGSEAPEIWCQGYVIVYKLGISEDIASKSSA